MLNHFWVSGLIPAPFNYHVSDIDIHLSPNRLFYICFSSCSLVLSTFLYISLVLSICSLQYIKQQIRVRVLLYTTSNTSNSWESRVSALTAIL